MAHVLVVEPDLGLRNWCRMHLATAGHEVATADDARRALKVATDRAPDLVIIDTELPGATAFALAANLRAGTRTAGIPIVFIVPPGDGAAIAQAAAIAPGRILTKPMSRALLVDTVGTQLAAAAPVETTPSSHAGASAASARARDGATTASALRAPVRQQLSLETKQASVLVVSLRNLVSLARSLPARSLDPLLQYFLTEARDAVTGLGGWVTRIDANGLAALFENSPHAGRGHAPLAVEAALRVVAAARRTKRWAATNLAEPFTPDLSVGCGVHSGEVLVARLAFGGLLLPSIAGQTVDVALRLNGRAKGLGWSVATTEEAARMSGARFEFGRTASLTDSDHEITVGMVEVIGLSPGAALPGELADMAEIREAVLANTVMAHVAGDADPQAADRTVVIRAADRADMLRAQPVVPGRRILRRLGQGAVATTYHAVHDETGRQEALRTVQLEPHDPGFVDTWLDQYRLLARLQHRNVVRVIDLGRTGNVAWVASEWVAGEPLGNVIRLRMPIGRALQIVRQLLEALREVHSIGQWHGALRAEHVRVADGRQAVLIDFNVSQRAARVSGGDLQAAAAFARAQRGAPEPVHAARDAAAAVTSPSGSVGAPATPNRDTGVEDARQTESSNAPAAAQSALSQPEDAPVGPDADSERLHGVPGGTIRTEGSGPGTDASAAVALPLAEAAGREDAAAPSASDRPGLPPVHCKVLEEGVRADLHATGVLLLAMLAADPAAVEAALRFELPPEGRDGALPIQLVSIQPLLDRLTGNAALPPFSSAEEALQELQAVQSLWSQPLYP